MFAHPFGVFNKKLWQAMKCMFLCWQGTRNAVTNLNACKLCPQYYVDLITIIIIIISVCDRHHQHLQFLSSYIQNHITSIQPLAHYIERFRLLMPQNHNCLCNAEAIQLHRIKLKQFGFFINDNIMCQSGIKCGVGSQRTFSHFFSALSAYLNNF